MIIMIEIVCVLGNINGIINFKINMANSVWGSTVQNQPLSQVDTVPIISLLQRMYLRTCTYQYTCSHALIGFVHDFIRK